MDTVPQDTPLQDTYTEDPYLLQMGDILDKELYPLFKEEWRPDDEGLQDGPKLSLVHELIKKEGARISEIVLFIRSYGLVEHVEHLLSNSEVRIDEKRSLGSEELPAGYAHLDGDIVGMRLIKETDSKTTIIILCLFEVNKDAETAGYLHNELVENFGKQ